MKKEEIIKTGVVGKFAGWRVGGKTYDPEGNEIPDVHDEDCFCCTKKSLLK